MPHDAVAVGYKVVEKDAHGGHDLVLRATHEAPANDDGGVAEDPFKEYDLFVANRAIEVLLTAYPGYPWTAKHDTVLNRETGNHDKLLLIAIPILMGVNNYMAINRQTHPLTPGRIIVAGGEILERYDCRRGRMLLEEFLDARAKNSALVVPSRAVPR
jgi:hypothetical protein